MKAGHITIHHFQSQKMIRLDEKTAVIIEVAAVDSLKEHKKSWKKLSEKDLLDRQVFHLDELMKFNDTPLNQILDGMSADTFMGICVRLAIIQTLLNGKSGYRDN